MIQLSNVSKSYRGKGGQIVVGLQDVSIGLEAGELVGLMGASGSGKTTLLLTVGGMQHPTSGKVSIANHRDIYSLSQAARTSIRSKHIGFVFQTFHLLPYLNVLDNVRLGDVSQSSPLSEVKALIDNLGLGDRIKHTPSQLSVGECQRVALARALVSRPDVILADEPTGNLDRENTSIVLGVLRDYCAAGGTVLLATHNDLSLPSMDRILEIRKGEVKERQTTCAE